MTDGPRRRRGRPKNVVLDDDANPVAGLSFTQQADGKRRYYHDHADGRKWYGSDRSLAIFRHRQFLSRADKKTVKLPVKQTSQVATWEEIDRHHDDPENVRLTPVTRRHAAAVDESVFLEKIRSLILNDPEAAAKKLNIPELAIIPEERDSIILQQIFEFWESRPKKITQKETTKVKDAWLHFSDCVGCQETKKITHAAVGRYESFLYETLNDGGSPNSFRNNLGRVKSVFNYAIKKLFHAAECTRIAGYLRSIDIPKKPAADPKPISREDFHTLLNAADARWKTILLLSLNCVLYGSEVIRLRKSAVNLQKGIIIDDRDKTTNPRVAILWQQTIDAIKEYQKQFPHNATTIIATENGKPFDHKGDGFLAVFRAFRENAGADENITFGMIRDGGYTAAIQGGADITTAKLLAGQITGISDHYVKRSPEMVRPAIEAIERHYFGA